MALAMFWKVGWSLVLGFAISAALQAVTKLAGHICTVIIIRAKSNPFPSA